MIDRSSRWASRQLERALLLAMYVLVVLPASAIYRMGRRVMPLRPDPAADTYWTPRGQSDAPPFVYSSSEMIVTLRTGSALGGYVRSVTSEKLGRRVVAALLAGALAPLRWTRTSESPRIDPDIYAMH